MALTTLGYGYYSVSKFLGTFTSFTKPFAHNSLYPFLSTYFFYIGYLFFTIVREIVNSYYCFETKKLHILNVFFQISNTEFHFLQGRSVVLFFFSPSVMTQGANRCYNHHCIGS